MSSILRFTQVGLLLLMGLCLFLKPAAAQNPPVSCDSSGNWFMFTNYDGGRLKIIIDQNIPNLKIGICTYEPVEVTITGSFASNLIDLYYAGTNSAANNNHCGFPISTSSFSGISPSLVTVNVLPPVGIISPPNPSNILNLPNGFNFGINCLASCDVNTYQGGCNTFDQVYDHFQTRFGGSLRGATVQYCCWSDTTPYRLSALTGSCCGSGNSSAAGINYPAGPFCRSTGSLVPVIQGNTSGTFYANPVGLSINPASGAVDLGGSQPGTYEIVYAIQFDCQSIILKDTITVLQGGSIGQQSITACDSYTAPWGDTYTQSGTYSDTISTGSGCDSIRIVNLTIIPGTLQAQIARVNPDTCTDRLYSFSLSASQPITTYDWNFGDPNTGSGNVSTAPSPTHNFSAAGTFDIRCIATFACGTDTSTLRLTIDDCDENPCTPTIPNVFTPNSDGINELFRPTALCTWPVYELEIYNRWGQKVFATTSQSEGWDGTVKGNESPDGTYIYRLTYKNPKETQKTLTGAVILIR